jgi:hypothetical protein
LTTVLEDFMDSVGADVERRMVGIYATYASALGVDISEDLLAVTTTTWQTASRTFVEELNQILGDVVVKAGNRVLTNIGPANFTVNNPFTPAWLTEHAFKLVGDLTSDNQQALRLAIASSVQMGETRRAISHYLKATVGLGTYDMGIVNRWREKNPTATMAEVERVSAKRLKDRAERIARTELVAASNHGANASWMVAATDGLISPDTRRIWIAGAGSERTCPMCMSMHGQEMELGKPFLSDGKPVMAPPLHPRCRCTTSIVTGGKKRTTNWISKADGLNIGSILNRRRAVVAEVRSHVRDALRQDRKDRR